MLSGTPMKLTALALAGAAVIWFGVSLPSVRSDGVAEDSRPLPTMEGPATTPEADPTTRPRQSTTYFILPDVDPSARAALEDGVVTREAYDAAVARTLACLDEKGVAYSEPVYEAAQHQYSYTITNAQNVSSGGGMSSHDECSFQFERDIQVAWVAQNS